MEFTCTISQSLQELTGKPAWGLKRTHGSMFLLELGKPAVQRRKSVRGEWSFLFESVYWQFWNHSGLFLTSTDSRDLIESRFEEMQLGMVNAAAFDQRAERLTIEFTTGISLIVESDASFDEFDDTEWIFFIPHELAWGKTKTTLTLDGIHGTSKPN